MTDTAEKARTGGKYEIANVYLTAQHGVKEAVGFQHKNECVQASV